MGRRRETLATSLDSYRGAIKNHIRPALGELRIGEATTQRIDTVISTITERAGAPRAKTCRDLGLTLRALRRQTGQTRKQVAETLNWPQTRIELIETGRIKIDHQLVSDLIKTYGIQLEDSASLLTQVDDATQPAAADKLAWIRSHALRKTTATALDQQGHTARQIADQLGQAKVPITPDIYMGRAAANPAAAEALQRAFEDPHLL